MSKTTQLLEDLRNRFEVLEKKVEELSQPEIVRPSEPLASDDVILALGAPSETIPASYRGVVNQVLNKEFSVHIKSEGDYFKFTILVPEKYSSLTSEQRQILKFDMRPRMIANAEGENGVKLWADTVFSSFNPAIQAQIVGDRLATL